MHRLEWIDKYIQRIRPYVFVRTEDNILIKRPNQAHRLNPSGAMILDRLLNCGEKIGRIVEEQRDKETVIRDLDVFFRDVRMMLTSGLPECYRSPAIREVLFDHHFSTLPILSEIAVTYRCNLLCRFCYAGCNCTRNPTDSDEQLDTAGIARLIDILVDEGRVPSVSFTGGEPTLRGDLPELIAHAKRRGLRVNLITNGTRCWKSYVEDLKSAGLDSAQVSIEASTAELHDRITRVPRSFEKATAAVGYFQEAGIHVHINTTLNRLNVPDATNMPDFAKSLGLDRFSMNMMIPAGTGFVEKQLVVSYTEIGPILDDIQVAASAAGVEFMWYSPTPLCLYNTIAHGLGNKGCAACDGLISVAPNGDVLPCSSYPQPVGNLIRDGFREVWFGKSATCFREKEFAHESCRACGHFSACQGACPLYWQAQGYEELFPVQPTMESQEPIHAST